jgi:hypothetical protein
MYFRLAVGVELDRQRLPLTTGVEKRKSVIDSIKSRQLAFTPGATRFRANFQTS